jgi:predicted ATPase
MELVYLWIDHYRNIKKTGFTFSYEFNFDLDIENNKLKIQHSSNHYRMFDDAFLGITAIVGKNGSGKSTLLTFMKMMFDAKPYFHLNYIAIFHSKDGQLFIKDELITKYGKSIAIEYAGKYVLNDFSEIDSFSELIYQSNSFSIYDPGIDSNKIFDVSISSRIQKSIVEANELLWKQIENLNSEYSKNEIDDKYLWRKKSITHNIYPLNITYDNELKDSINFISNYNEQHWNFIPKSIDLNFNTLLYYSKKEYFNDLSLVSSYHKILEYVGSSSGNYPLLKHKEIFKNKLILSLFMHYSLYLQSFHTIHDFDSLISSMELETEIDNMVLKIRDFFLGRLNNPSDRNSQPLSEFISNIDTKFNNFSFSNFTHIGTYSFPVNEGILDTIRELSGIWFGFHDIFKYSWLNLSIGEGAFISMFSRLHSIKSLLLENKSIWILLDEPDLYLHPEWQRVFFNYLHTYLPKLFPDRKIQLFLTSHSPFLVSDLPADNIILLDKDADGWSKVLDNKRLGNTFGANIHTLFTDAFFLQNGLIGEFAKTKIFELLSEIEVLQNPNESSIESFKKRIDIIGEPMIRQRLFEILLSKAAPNDKLKRREFLQRELDKLESSNN